MKIVFNKKNFPETTEQWFQEIENNLKKLFSVPFHFRYEGKGQVATLSLKRGATLDLGIHSYKKAVARKVILDKKITLNGEYYSIQVKEIFFFNHTTMFINGEIENEDGYILSESKLQIKRFVVFNSDNPVCIRDDSAVIVTATPKSPLKSRETLREVPSNINTTPEEWEKYQKFLAKCKRQEKIVASGYTSGGWHGDFFLLRSEVEEKYEPSSAGSFNAETLPIWAAKSAKGYCIKDSVLTVGTISLRGEERYAKVLSYEMIQESISKEVHSRQYKSTGYSNDQHWRGMPIQINKTGYYKYRSQKIKISTSCGNFVVDFSDTIPA